MKKIIFALAILSLFAGAVSWAGFFDEEDLFNACKDGDAERIKVVLKAGVDVNCSDEDGVTPFMYAAWQSPNPNIIPILVKAGADVNATDNKGRTALIFAMSNGAKTDRMVGAIIKASKGLNLNTQDDDYDLTALMWAVNAGLKSVIPILLEAGADVNLRDKKGNRAVDYAEKNEALKGTAALKKLQELSKQKAQKETEPERWQAYINARFGYSVHYPAIFDNQRDPDNGDGIWLTLKSKKYALTISGGYNVLDDDGESRLASRLENIADIVPGSDKSEETWYRVIYGGDSLSHEYGIINDENWASFILTYPKNEQARFAPIISQMEESLSIE